MKYIIYILAAVLAIFIAISIFTETGNMTENEKFIKEAEEKIEAFKSEKEPERLRESSMALENIVLAKEHNTEIRKKMRSKSLNLWLTLLQILDKNLDPNFDSEDIPMRSIVPPPTSNGAAYPAGADPALIDDPKARAEYEKAIAENRKKTENYRLQIQLGRLNEKIPPRAENFIRNSFNDSMEDQEELRTAIEAKIEKPERKADLLKLLEPSQPPQ